MKNVELKPGLEYIDLCDLMKIADMTDSGGAAKHLIAEGLVKVDGNVETRKRCKIRKGQVVEFKGQQVTLV
ncbi:MAG: RNA-binding S4 domain-containing protein [Bacteriovoracia bacterium]